MPTNCLSFLDFCLLKCVGILPPLYIPRCTISSETLFCVCFNQALFITELPSQAWSTQKSTISLGCLLNWSEGRWEDKSAIGLPGLIMQQKNWLLTQPMGLLWKEYWAGEFHFQNQWIGNRHEWNGHSYEWMINRSSNTGWLILEQSSFFFSF